MIPGEFKKQEGKKKLSEACPATKVTKQSNPILWPLYGLVTQGLFIGKAQLSSIDCILASGRLHIV